MDIAPTSESSPEVGSWQWKNSGATYVFAGIAALMGLIALSLLILGCCRRKSHDQSSSLPTGIDEAVSTTREEAKLVIMAGDDAPSFLAKPASSVRLAQVHA